MSNNAAVTGNITHLIEKQVDPLVQAIARVAHEVSAATAKAFGDYATLPWEKLDDVEQSNVYRKVEMFMADPSKHATSMLLMGAASIPDAARAAAFAFHGVVHAIAREQSRT